LKYSIMLNGVTRLIMTKADVLDHFDTIKIATAYKTNTGITTEFPFDLNENVKPSFETLPGWNTSLNGIESDADFPQELKQYIEYIEKNTGVPVSIVSVGPNRKETIFLK